MQQLQAELRLAQQTIAVKQEETTRLNQEGARLIAELTHARQSLAAEEDRAKRRLHELEYLWIIAARHDVLAAQAADREGHAQELRQQLAAITEKRDNLVDQVRGLEQSLAKKKARADAHEGVAVKLQALLEGSMRLPDGVQIPEKRYNTRRECKWRMAQSGKWISGAECSLSPLTTATLWCLSGAMESTLPPATGFVAIWKPWAGRRCSTLASDDSSKRTVKAALARWWPASGSYPDRNSQNMGQAKIKRREGFAPSLIEEWEADDCVNFAVALARLTGWLLHVDWWSTTPAESVSEDQLKPLRVYVADNREGIFDVRGIKTLVDFNHGTIGKLAQKIGTGYGGVRTRYYSETKLSSLPLRCLPDESKIARAMDAIKANPAFLNAIPAKPRSRIPAYDAARYTFGRCVAYAEAMHQLTGLQPAAILVRRFAPLYDKTKRSENGFVHSIVMHPDGMGEDAWGVAPIEDIAGRFGAIEFGTSAAVHQEVVANYRRTSNDIYEAGLKAARELILRYRLDSGAS